MIACPRCSSPTEVVETRGDRRRRVCPMCLARFTTTESSAAERPASAPPRKGGRRSISFARPLFNAAKEVAAAEGVSLAEWVARLIRAAIPGVAFVAPAVETTRSDLDAMAAARRTPRPGDPAPHAKTCAWGVTCEGPFVLSTYDDKLVPACATHAEEAEGERTDRTWKRRAAK